VELYQLYKDPNIIKIVKANRIRWLGHIFRTDDSNLCKKVTFNNPLYGERRIGRPTTRWLDDVENDLKKINVNQWKIKARDRVIWRSITGAVLA
jgi:hypothetical protein